MGGNVFGLRYLPGRVPTWNRRENRRPVQTSDPPFAPREFAAPPLEKMAALSEPAFRELFCGTPITRAKYSGFLRNVAIAMGNSGLGKFRQPLEKLAGSSDPVVAEHTVWAIKMLSS